MPDVKARFIGSVPEYYDRCLVPAWFGVFAADLAQRLPAKPPGDVLEIACGTGCLTEQLRARLDPAVRLVASDLNQPMLDFARAKLGDREGIEWRQADAGNLPFRDGEFGAVVCAFGFMFVPDKPAAFREARRVLRTGGHFLFTVWDRMEENPHVMANAAVVEGLFPNDPDLHFGTPFEMHDSALLRQLLAQAPFQEVRIERKRLQVGNVGARTVATGLIRGTPRSLLIGKRGVALDEVIEKVTAALTKIGGDPYRGHAQAVVVEARAGHQKGDAAL